ncbi:nuclear transport factor 2 family protein [Streptomyces spongiae]|uniref:Nuclear transport factor 2 family protein n=1 Tax=Streptomyces spongiae TaxID=565072 RepID=A0A5N8XAY6_9ACTN|nr:nuclear transport factor 2 family protein [Streptomyces spongiae]MPY55685.1 nuclear transport factor 2 family protein [Streptomyces spongiae]
MGGMLDPKSVMEAYVRDINAKDLEAVLALFDDSVTVPGFVRQLFSGNTGKDVLRRYIGETVIAQNGRLETVRIAVSADGWAFGELALSSDMVRTFGQERITGIDQLQVRDGKIIAFKFLPDILDDQTRAYYVNMGVLGAASEASG